MLGNDRGPSGGFESVRFVPSFGEGLLDRR